MVICDTLIMLEIERRLTASCQNDLKIRTWRSQIHHPQKEHKIRTLWTFLVAHDVPSYRDGFGFAPKSRFGTPRTSKGGCYHMTTTLLPPDALLKLTAHLKVADIAKGLDVPYTTVRRYRKGISRPDVMPYNLIEPWSRFCYQQGLVTKTGKPTKRKEVSHEG